jgi:hypothetical protein
MLKQAKLEIKTDTRIALLEQAINHSNESLMRIEKALETGFMNCYRRFEDVDKRFVLLDQRLDKLNDRMWGNFQWILSTMFTLACAGAGVLAKGFGWFS